MTPGTEATSSSVPPAVALSPSDGLALIQRITTTTAAKGMRTATAHFLRVSSRQRCSRERRTGRLRPRPAVLAWRSGLRGRVERPTDQPCEDQQSGGRQQGRPTDQGHLQRRPGGLRQRRASSSPDRSTVLPATLAVSSAFAGSSRPAGMLRHSIDVGVCGTDRRWAAGRWSRAPGPRYRRRPLRRGRPAVPQAGDFHVAERALENECVAGRHGHGCVLGGGLPGGDQCAVETLRPVEVTARWVDPRSPPPPRSRCPAPRRGSATVQDWPPRRGR